MTSPPKKRAKFVFVPAHLTEPLEECEVEYTEAQAVECLLDRVKVRGRERRRALNALVAASTKRKKNLTLNLLAPLDDQTSSSLGPLCQVQGPENRRPDRRPA